LVALLAFDDNSKEYCLCDSRAGALMLGALALSLRYRDKYGRCSVCGRWGLFRRQHASIREGHRCSHCAASLRYRHQASVIVAKYATKRSKSFAELAREPRFLGLSIYEPGIIGPFRQHLKAHPNYTTSYLWEGVAPGESHKGVRCENLESLTFANDTFDLVSCRTSSSTFESPTWLLPRFTGCASQEDATNSPYLFPGH
jgi:hypothetical protein